MDALAAAALACGPWAGAPVTWGSLAPLYSPVPVNVCWRRLGAAVLEFSPVVCDGVPLPSLCRDIDTLVMSISAIDTSAVPPTIPYTPLFGTWRVCYSVTRIIRLRASAARGMIGFGTDING